MIKKIELEINSVCNLSRIPVNILNNPIREAICSNDICETLTNYYENITYKNLNDLYKTNIKKLNNLSHTTIFLPWYHKNPVMQFEDYAFITRISKEKIKEKEIKINNILNSIKENGYKPNKFIDRKLGYITGYFLKSKENKKFYVVSGNHRVAILHSLGFKKVPALIESTKFFKSRDKVEFGYKNMPEFIERKNVNNWPAVMSNFLKTNEALEIFDSFFGE